MYEDNIEYAVRRLKETVVQHNGEAIFIEGIDDDGEVAYSKEDGSIGTTTLDKLNPEPVPLGYVKLDDVWTWLCRIPKRNDWRQGHHTNNIACYQNVERYRHKNIRVGHFNFLLKGVYDNYHDCLKNGGAFSRNYCFEDNTLFYKGDAIGTVVGGVLSLTPANTHHKKRLERTYQ